MFDTSGHEVPTPRPLRAAPQVAQAGTNRKQVGQVHAGKAGVAPPDGSLTYHHVVVGVPSDQLFPISVRGVREGWMGAERGGGGGYFYLVYREVRGRRPHLVHLG